MPAFSLRSPRRKARSFSQDLPPRRGVSSVRPVHPASCPAPAIPVCFRAGRCCGRRSVGKRRVFCWTRLPVRGSLLQGGRAGRDVKVRPGAPFGRNVPPLFRPGALPAPKASGALPFGSAHAVRWQHRSAPDAFSLSWPSRAAQRDFVILTPRFATSSGAAGSPCSRTRE